MIARFLSAGRPTVVTGALATCGAIAFADWAVGNGVSLGVLYILPMMLVALLLRPAELVVFALLFSVLRGLFDTPGLPFEQALRFVFATAAYWAVGLFVNALVRNREFIVRHLAELESEKTLRQGAEQQLNLMVESSSAAILTADCQGRILAANDSAGIVFGAGSPHGLLGKDVRGYLPVLADALELNAGSQVFKTAALSQAQRENGEVFLAHTWFSTYRTPQGLRLAAIVADSSEEMKDREEQNLRQLLEYNRITAAALSHEVRNACSALAIIAGQLKEKHNLSADADYQVFSNLLHGLETLAHVSLKSHVDESSQRTSLLAVLNNLRIIVEAEWHDIGGITEWPGVGGEIEVFADPHGLLQALLNLAQNSYRAVRDTPSKNFHIGIESSEDCTLIRVSDSGPGVAAPDQLFRPFHAGSDGAGLGLYISRAIIRGFGGELRHEPCPAGTCFVVELQRA